MTLVPPVSMDKTESLHDDEEFSEKETRAVLNLLDDINSDNSEPPEDDDLDDGAHIFSEKDETNDPLDESASKIDQMIADIKAKAENNSLRAMRTLHKTKKNASHTSQSESQWGHTSTPVLRTVEAGSEFSSGTPSAMKSAHSHDGKGSESHLLSHISPANNSSKSASYGDLNHYVNIQDSLSSLLPDDHPEDSEIDDDAPEADEADSMISEEDDVIVTSRQSQRDEEGECASEGERSVKSNRSASSVKSNRSASSKSSRKVRRNSTSSKPRTLRRRVKSEAADDARGRLSPRRGGDGVDDNRSLGSSRRRSRVAGDNSYSGRRKMSMSPVRSSRGSRRRNHSADPTTSRSVERGAPRKSPVPRRRRQKSTGQRRNRSRSPSAIQAELTAAASKIIIPPALDSETNPSELESKVEVRESVSPDPDPVSDDLVQEITNTPEEPMANALSEEIRADALHEERKPESEPDFEDLPPVSNHVKRNIPLSFDRGDESVSSRASLDFQPMLLQFDPSNANNLTAVSQDQAAIQSETIKLADGTESELQIRKLAGLPTFEVSKSGRIIVMPNKPANHDSMNSLEDSVESGESGSDDEDDHHHKSGGKRAGEKSSNEERIARMKAKMMKDIRKKFSKRNKGNNTPTFHFGLGRKGDASSGHFDSSNLSEDTKEAIKKNFFTRRKKKGKDEKKDKEKKERKEKKEKKEEKREKDKKDTETNTDDSADEKEKKDAGRRTNKRKVKKNFVLVDESDDPDDEF